MGKLLSNRILISFLLWRVGLFLAAFFAFFLIPDFGWRFPYYDQELLPTGLPEWLIGFGNFDGVHYIRIAKFGYEAQFSQVFFPLYPMLIKSLTFGGHFFLTAFVISNVIFLGALYLLYKLFLLDFDRKIAFSAVGLLLLFPTSFYFGSVYSESLFLLISTASLFLLRKKNFLIGGFLVGIASATRVVGLVLLPVFLIELFLSLKNNEIKAKSEEFFKAVFGLLLSVSGIFFYMFYLKISTGNPFFFLTAQPVFGAERSSEPVILLPQVLIRYLKMLLTVPLNSLPFFNVVLELVFTVFPLFLLILAYKKIRMSYWVFTLGCLLLPTLTGTLSSMPRYSLMSFLTFPILAKFYPKYLKLIIPLYVILAVLLVALFTRGYWVA